jgi:hypothetical protein
MTARDIPAALASRFVDPENLPWEKTRYPGIEQKVLLVDPKTGLLPRSCAWPRARTCPIMST